MKKTILLSAITVSILFGTALSANSYQDSVSLKESKAIKNSEVKGEDAAKAKVEEASDKREFMDKMDRENFEKNSQKDKNKKLH